MLVCIYVCVRLASYLYRSSPGELKDKSFNSSSSGYIALLNGDWCTVSAGLSKATLHPLSDSKPERDAVKARPASGEQPGRFDTVVVLQGEEAEATGLQGT